MFLFGLAMASGDFSSLRGWPGWPTFPGLALYIVTVVADVMSLTVQCGGRGYITSHYLTDWFIFPEMV